MSNNINRSKKRKKNSPLRWIMKRVGIGLIVGLIMISAVIVWQFFNKTTNEPKVTVITMYEDLIRSYAEEYGLEPAYVASVIMAESSYRAEAISSANAQGLMQILPTTGEWIAGKLDEEWTDGVLLDPEVSIRYGCWYLNYLMNRFGNDMTCASSAYHQGQGTVDKWLQDPEISADGVTLTNIPSDATRTYVERILRYYDRYKEIYA